MLGKSNFTKIYKRVDHSGDTTLKDIGNSVTEVPSKFSRLVDSCVCI